MAMVTRQNLLKHSILLKFNEKLHETFLIIFRILRAKLWPNMGPIGVNV